LRPDYSQLPKNKKIVFLASGGRDSTAMILEAYSQGIQGIMLHGDTTLEKEDALITLERLQKYTGYELIDVYPSVDVKECLDESFKRIPDALRFMEETGKYRRNVFQCCKHLKHNPMNNYVKKHCSNAVLVLGLKITDGSINRYYRMRQLQESNTLVRVHKNGLMYYYPLRDLRKCDISNILSQFGFQDTKHSGCSICPIFVMFPNWHKRDSWTWIRSRKKARKMGISFPECEQTMITQFCSGMKEG
jgi:3'-phosphoadenosine 5'-phosphosulfate sulfotransferase (PAPS reductase)/FAD synthetase